jgi:hypothetical protein
MGSEIAGPVFAPIVLIVVIILTTVAIRGRRRLVSEASTLGLGRSRIALGYLGSLLASIPVALWMARDDAQSHVANHLMSADEAARFQPGWALTFYFLVTPFVLFLTTVVGLPVLALLRKLRLASVVGALGASLIVSVGLSFWIDSTSVADVVILETITAGFVLGARLPWIRSAALLRREALHEIRKVDEG